MKRRILTAALLLALTCARATTDTFAPANVVDPTNQPTALVELRKAIEERGAIQAAFLETRQIVFKRDVIQLRGILAYSPEKGLSLYYLEPEENRVILSGASLLTEGEDGALQERRIPARYASLQAILTLDVEALAKQFKVYYTPGNEWRFGLLAEGETRTGPRRSIGSPTETIVVSGKGTIVERIELQRAGSMKVVIEIADIAELDAGDTESINRFFGS